MTTRAPVTDAIGFAERVVALLDEGAFTATYKYAVLLGLLDVVMERTSATGERDILRGKVRQRISILDLRLPERPPQGAEWIHAFRR